jgi:nucleoside 2-deoxyribosyltransferase
MTASHLPWLVGEIIVDYAITSGTTENKLRLGGIVHAARGFWASGQPYVVAAVLPSYMEELARNYLTAHGCQDLHILGHVTGAPNVMVNLDAIELADQGYENLLFEEKAIIYTDADYSTFPVEDILLFPGSYDLGQVSRRLPESARLHIDVAYDVADGAALLRLRQPVETIFTSTSSPLFLESGAGNVRDTAQIFAASNPSVVILKENRGGSTLLEIKRDEIEALPAQLGATENSVGVGDVFAAAYVSALLGGPTEAGWRATRAASAYAQTTYPDDFRDTVQQSLKLSLQAMRDLGGVFLPWEVRPSLDIYLAAPDFAEGDRKAIEEVIRSLAYHNFALRRPVQENGELAKDSDFATLKATFLQDYKLLKECVAVFAVPTGRDPGTLVEIGIAIEAGIPVIVYDPSGENNNTMVMAGAVKYSNNLDECLNELFCRLAKVASTT